MKKGTKEPYCMIQFLRHFHNDPVAEIEDRLVVSRGNRAGGDEKQVERAT